MLRFSANLSVLFNEVELDQRFMLARHYGFNEVEIQFPYAYTAKQLKALLDEQQLQLVLFNVAAADLLQGGEGLAAVPQLRAQFQAAVDQAVHYAEILKPAAINVLPGRCLTPERLPEYLETLSANLAYAVEAFAPLGIKTVFEAINTFDMPGFVIHTSQQMLNLLEQLQLPNLYMQYDVYHMQRMGDNSAAFIMQHASKIGHIQFADVPGRGQPGTGHLDFSVIFAAIAASGYKGWVGAEYHPQGQTADSFYSWLKHKEI